MQIHLLKVLMPAFLLLCYHLSVLIHCTSVSAVLIRTLINFSVLSNNYSSSPNGLLTQRPMRARGIIVLVKFNQLVKNIEKKKISQLKLDLNPFLPPKSPRFSLLVGYNIQPSSSSTNQNAALIIDHKLDITNYFQLQSARLSNSLRFFVFTK